MALKVQPAGLGAAPAVAAALPQHAAEVTLPGNAHAQRPVHKDLAPHACPGADGDDLLLGKLPGQHHLGKAHFLQQPGARQVVDGHLGAGVQRQGGVPLPDDFSQAQILHQHAIHPGGGYRIQGMEPLGQLPVGHQCVQRYIDPYPAGMAPANGLRQGVFVKVFGARARIKAAQPQINGIGAAQDGGAQLRLAARRRQYFSVFFHFAQDSSSFSS